MCIRDRPKSSGGTLLLVLAVAVIGGVAGWYFKIYRPKKQQAADAAEDYGDDYNCLLYTSRCV